LVGESEERSDELNIPDRQCGVTSLQPLTVFVHTHCSVGETDSVVFGMDCEDEGIMGEKMVRSYEEGCTVEEYNDWRKSGTVICEVITYEEEEDWREKYGSVGEGEGK